MYEPEFYMFFHLNFHTQQHRGRDIKQTAHRRALNGHTDTWSYARNEMIKNNVRLENLEDQCYVRKYQSLTYDLYIRIAAGTVASEPVLRLAWTFLLRVRVQAHHKDERERWGHTILEQEGRVVHPTD
ncbi:hypothetical protein PoB_001079800 [Plakobranchus ocellatus]|uniref:Uncharacterized protein n=1 Tax=Plakobranchus ocellatus TaxID=259542 RepID=A0AAV3YPV5_9GAST|nr:hypothetical protein PoB_001079800 [Plakobranchus ocellatus]